MPINPKEMYHDGRHYKRKVKPKCKRENINQFASERFKRYQGYRTFKQGTVRRTTQVPEALVQQIRFICLWCNSQGDQVAAMEKIIQFIEQQE